MDEFPYLGSIADALTYGDHDIEISTEDIRQLLAIKTGADITSVEMHGTWTDDHEMCVNLTVNGVDFAAMWIIPEFFADIVYATKGSIEGKNAVAEYIVDVLRGVDMTAVVVAKGV